jgi:hypothetical protein
MSEPAARCSAPPPRLVMRRIFIFALLLFVPAGTLRWPGTWAFLAIMAVASFGGVEWLRRHDPELLRERLKPPFQHDQKPWDKVLMAIFLPLWFAWFVLMAIDRRFGWSDVPIFAQVLGAVLVTLGMLLVFRVLKENSYAAPVWRNGRWPPNLRAMMIMLPGSATGSCRICGSGAPRRTCQYASEVPCPARPDTGRRAEGFERGN